jgi:ER membrane protein complex subunit 1
LGKVKFAHFDSVTADKAIVATEENVIAAVSCKDGEILWRKILETDSSRGEVKFLHVTGLSSSKSVVRGNEDSFGVISVSGSNPVLFRGWDLKTGNLAFEWSLTPLTDNDNAQYFVKDTKIYHVLPVWRSHIELTEYQASTGQQETSTTRKFTAGWITPESCLQSGEFFACITKNQLLVLDLLAGENNLRTKTLEAEGQIQAVRGQEGFVQVGRQVISLKDLQVVHENRNNANIFMDQSTIQLVQTDKEIKISMDGQELSATTDVPETLNNNLQILSAKCKPKKDSNQIVCRFLLSTSDGALTLIQQGKIKWTREEALTQIAAIDFLDLTLSDAQGAIEEELNSKDGEFRVNQLEFNNKSVSCIHFHANRGKKLYVNECSEF